MKKAVVAILLALFSISVSAQQDPEFPKGEFIMHLNFHSGIVTGFNNAPEPFVGGIQLIPQYTFVANLLRGGAIVDGFYTNKSLQGAIGPTLSIKLYTIKAQPFGSLGNINLSFDHLWGTGSERLLGGGVNADLGNLVVVGISLQRDYHLDNWWIQSNFALRISKIKKSKPIGSHN